MSNFYWCIEYLATFIEIFLCCYFCGTFVVKEKIQDVRKRIIVLSVTASVMIILLNKLELFSYLTTLIFILLCILMQCILYRESYLHLVALVLVYAAILSAIDFLVLYFVTINMNSDIGYLTGEQSLIRIICIMLSKCILILLVITLNRVIVHNIEIPIRYILITSVCSGFLLISNFVMVHTELNKSDGEISSFSMVFFIASLGIEMVIFCFLIKIAEGYEQKKVASLVELNNKMLQKSLVETQQAFDLWRKSIHDYKHNILYLTQLVDEGNIEEIKSYLSKENDMITKKDACVKTGNTVADAIINTKRNTAEKMGILFVVNASIPNKIAVSGLDLANILGNLIDNAIEAEQKEEEPYIEITIKQEKMFLIINVRNTCTFPTAPNLRTTKEQEEFHGIGLQSVRQTVEKYEGEITISTENNQFIVTILIQNKYE
ncbi:MAG: GHKL domain-containing protein [Lachnospiraceae bacterium]|nr:GHKL domain-containing protein [Lachnospiraceae bacterium]